MLCIQVPTRARSPGRPKKSRSLRCFRSEAKVRRLAARKAAVMGGPPAAGPGAARPSPRPRARSGSSRFSPSASQAVRRRRAQRSTRAPSSVTAWPTRRQAVLDPSRRSRPAVSSRSMWPDIADCDIPSRVASSPTPMPGLRLICAPQRRLAAGDAQRGQLACAAAATAPAARGEARFAMLHRFRNRITYLCIRSGNHRREAHPAMWVNKTVRHPGAFTLDRG